MRKVLIASKPETQSPKIPAGGTTRMGSDFLVSCPLLHRDIPEGLCLDINLQRLRCFKPDVLAEVQRKTGKTVEEISSICEVCPNLPLRKKQEGDE